MDRLWPPHEPRINPIRRIKVLSLGSKESGKSCIIKRFCEKRFVSKYMPTIGVDYGVTEYKYEGTVIKVNFFDLSGDDQFADTRQEFYADAQAILYVFDVTSRASFERLDSLLKESQLFSQDEYVAVLCANKVDRSNRKVSEGEAKLWAESRGFHYYETSAKSGENVENALGTIFQEAAYLSLHGGAMTHVTATYKEDDLATIERILCASNNYELLAVTKNATADEINKSYKRIAAQIHPDKNRAPKSEEAFKTLGQAKEQLLSELYR